MSIWYALVCVEPTGDGHPLPAEAVGAYTHVGARSESREEFEQLVQQATEARCLMVVAFEWAWPEELLEAQGRSMRYSEEWASALLDVPVGWDDVFHWWNDATENDMADDAEPGSALDDVERLAEDGELEAAARRVAEVEVREPKEAWRLGRVLELALDQPTEAEPLYRQALEAVPEAIVDLTMLLDGDGRPAEADELLRALPREEEGGWRVRRGRAYRADGDIERALAEYRRGVELEDLAALRYLAGTLSYEGAIEEARRWYDDPPFGADDPALRIDYVDLLQDLGERDAAVAELTALRERDVPDADRILGDILSEEDEVDLAVAHYLAAVGTGDTKALTNLGVTWGEKGRLAEAELALRRSWDDGDALAGRSLGKVLVQTGRGEEAREIWHQTDAAGDGPSGALLEAYTAEMPDGDVALVRASRDRAWPRVTAALLDALGPSPEQPEIWLVELHAAQITHLLSTQDPDAAVTRHLAIGRWGGSDAQRDAALAALRTLDHE